MQAVRSAAAPRTPLAAVQAAWREAVGDAVAARAAPVSERDGVVTVECDDAVWAQELDLMQETLMARLSEALGEAAPTTLRFRPRQRSR